MSCECRTLDRRLAALADLFDRHKSMLDYFQRSGYVESFESLKREANQDNFVIDSKARYVGLLEKKWTGVVRLQKRVSAIGIEGLLYIAV